MCNPVLFVIRNDEHLQIDEVDFWRILDNGHYATMIRLRSCVREARPSCRSSLASERRESGA